MSKGTIFTLNIWTWRLEQCIHRSHAAVHSHHISVYNVCHSFSISQTDQEVVKWICSNFRTSLVRSYGVRIFRVNMIIVSCVVAYFSVNTARKY